MNCIWFFLGEPCFNLGGIYLEGRFFFDWCGVSSSVSFVFKGSNLSFIGIVLILDLDLFFPSFVPCPCLSGGCVSVASQLGEVCGGPTTEGTSEVSAPGLFLSGFSCFSWLVATLVFGSFGEFFSDCSYNSFHLLDQSSHFIYKLGNHLGFCGCLVLHIWQLCLLAGRIFFLSLPCILWSLPSFLLLGRWYFGYVLVWYFFFFLPYLTTSRISTMYVIFSASSAHWWSCTLVLVVPKPNLKWHL